MHLRIAPASRGRFFRTILSVSAAAFTAAIGPTLAHAQRGQRTPVTPTLGLDEGTLDFDTPDFNLKLVKASQTIAAMQPKGAKAEGQAPFDFTPADQLPARNGDKFNHLGDISIRARTVGPDGPGEWKNLATSAARKPVKTIEDLAAAGAPSGKLIAGADLSPTLPDDCPLTVTRYWLLDPTNKLVLHFDIENKSDSPVEIGGLGFPVIFNNMIHNFAANQDRSLAQAHETCSFFDPYIGQDGGYLQVTRLSGEGPALVVVPEEGTRTAFEAFRPLVPRDEEASPRSQTFEGAFEWTVHSRAYAENEWKNVQQWNPGTSVTLKPGESVSHGLRFLVSDTIRNIEKTLAENNRPVVVGIPGYILPMDIDGKIFINPGKRKVVSLEPEPHDSLVTDSAGGNAANPVWQAYNVKGKNWGRARLTIAYDDGTKQSVHYYVIKPESQVVADLGNFLFTKQWYTDESDPFKRAPSVMTYDRGHDKIVTQDTRVWIAGLEDEGGAGSWIAAAMKEFGRPKKEELDKYVQFIDKVLWGGLQYSEGDRKYGVRKSLFFHDPQVMPDFQYQSGNWGGWTSWNKRDAERTDRAYNYPHVVAAYWSMYRLARNHLGLVTDQTWQWYLDHAYQTVRFLTSAGHGGANLKDGLMDGDIFLMLLEDLKREGWNEQADYVETAMKQRTDRWKGNRFPFGSEMAWDSTGQEEVYAWTTYFGYHDKAKVALDSILGYMPTLPHWGYNGNARRYWDFYYGAAPGGTTERQIHHYGSGINAVPVLAEFRQHPEDFYLLRVGYGGISGALSNIDQEGFASAAFHSYPQNLRWDTYSGDYGPNFFGHAVATGTYVVNHPDFGWQAFGGNLKADGDTVKVQPLDSFRQRVYLAPLGVWLTLDAGTFEAVELNPKTHAVRVSLSPADQYTRQARLRVEQPATIEGVGKFKPKQELASEREAFNVPLASAATCVDLGEEKN
jgi:hypothetical protein